MSEIEGLSFYPDYISGPVEKLLLDEIDAREWDCSFRRRVQHYGYRYDYAARVVGPKSYLGPLPEFLRDLCEQLVRENLFSTFPEQVIVNEYEPGQGIAPHIDCPPCFGDVIASLSLGSGCEMVFDGTKTGAKIAHFLTARSLLLLSGEARSRWRHSIAARKSDVLDGIRIIRQRRISLTFRTINRG